MSEQTPTTRKVKVFDENAKEMLQIDNLKVIFETPRSTIKAVDGVTFSVRERESFGIVGESGSGKSVTCRAIDSQTLRGLPRRTEPKPAFCQRMAQRGVSHAKTHAEKRPPRVHA